MNIYWQNQLSLKVCPNYSYIMNNESIFLRKGDICIILQFLHFLHTASISNQYIAWKLKLFNNFLYRAIIRADDQVLSTYKCTYNGSMRWPSTNKMNSVFSNDSSSSLFLFQCCSDKWELQKVKTSQFEDQRVSLCRLSAVSTKDVRSLNNFSFPPTYEFPWV